MKGLPEDFKKKVELLLRADHDDEDDLSGQVAQSKRHYAEILRVSGHDYLSMNDPIGSELEREPTPKTYAQIGPKTAASVLAAAKVSKEQDDSRPSSTQVTGHFLRSFILFFYYVFLGQPSGAKLLVDRLHTYELCLDQKSNNLISYVIVIACQSGKF